MKQSFTQIYAFQKGSDKERMKCHYFIKNLFQHGKNIRSVNAERRAKLQSLWSNEFIHTKSESFYDESLVSRGITTVSNLFDNEGELKNWETVSREFSLNPIHFLKWYGVMKSIPSCWKKTLKGYNTEDNILSEEESQCGIEANGKFIPLNSVTAKLVYKLHVSQKFSPLTSKRLLSNKFNIADQNIWSSVYL